MIDGEHPLLLGSASPRRREILATLGIPLRVVGATIDETPLTGEHADAYMERVVGDKLRAVATEEGARDAGALLVADTSVLVDGAILGKPADDADARRMLRALSGRSHEVWTRFAISGPDAPSRALTEETVRTRVFFRALGDGEIARYIATGEGRDKAGAYAIQGIGAFVVSRIEGSYSNVVGLPACEVVAALISACMLDAFPLDPPRR